MKIREKYNHWLPKMLKVSAITLYPFIFFDSPQSGVTTEIKRHEYVHVSQVNEKIKMVLKKYPLPLFLCQIFGIFLFYGEYCWQWLKKWIGPNWWRIVFIFSACVLIALAVVGWSDGCDKAYHMIPAEIEAYLKQVDGK